MACKEPSQQAEGGTQGNKYRRETDNKEEGVQHHPLLDMLLGFEIIKRHPRYDRKVRWQQR